MKKLMFVLLIAVSFSCEQEQETPIVNQQSSSNARIETAGCGPGQWENYINSYTCPGGVCSYNQVLSGHLYENPIYFNLPFMVDYTINVTFKNNSSTYTVKLYVDNMTIPVATLAPQETFVKTYSYTCECFSTCTINPEYFYSYKVKKNTFGPSGQVQFIVTATVNAPHTFNSIGATLQFQ